MSYISNSHFFGSQICSLVSALGGKLISASSSVRSTEVWSICFPDGSLTCWEVTASQGQGPGASVTPHWVSPCVLGSLTVHGWVSRSIIPWESQVKAVLLCITCCKSHKEAWKSDKVLSRFKGRDMDFTFRWQVLQFLVKSRILLQACRENTLICTVWLNLYNKTMM